MSRSVLERRD